MAVLTLKGIAISKYGSCVKFADAIDLLRKQGNELKWGV